MNMNLAAIVRLRPEPSALRLPCFATNVSVEFSITSNATLSNRASCFLLHPEGIRSRTPLSHLPSRHCDRSFRAAQRNFTSLLDSMVEQCESAPVTPASILRAIRAYSCPKAHGRWVEPPNLRTVTQVNRHSSPSRNPSRDTAIRKRHKSLKTNATRKF